MAHDAWTTRDAVASPRASALLGVEHGRVPGWSFFSALRRIECAHRALPRLGEASAPSDEPMRLGQRPSLAFQGAALAAVVDGDDLTPDRIAVSFFGLFGPHGPLPSHLTEYAHQRALHHGDHALARFADIFHHRLLSLLYRAWADAQPTVSYDRPEHDRFARYLGALVGQSTSATPTAPDELDHAVLFAAVHGATQTRHAEGLAKLLSGFFGVPVEIVQFVGGWLGIPEAFRWRMPGSDTGARIGVLGESTRVGSEVWDCTSKFRVVIGPVNRAEYERFLPGGDHLRRLIALVERYAGPELSWDLRLVLREPDRRPAVLGVVGALGRTAHLGGGAGPSGLAFDDLVLDPADHAA